MTTDAGERLAARSSVQAEQAPPLAPDSSPIDRAHLAQMTLGDRGLEAEVLGLFAQQSGMLVARMAGAAPKVVGALAHTLTGSARGVGAWRVAEAAEMAERAAADGDPNRVSETVAQLSAAVHEARTAVGEIARS